MDADIWFSLAQSVVQSTLAIMGIVLSRPAKRSAPSNNWPWLLFVIVLIVGLCITGWQGYSNSQEKRKTSSRLAQVPTIATGVEAIKADVQDIIQNISAQSPPLTDEKKGMTNSVARNKKAREDLAVFQFEGIGIQVECETDPKSTDEAIYERFRKWDAAFQKYAFSQLDKSYYSRFEDTSGLPVMPVPLLATQQRTAVWQYVRNRQIRLQEFIREHKDS